MKPEPTGDTVMKDVALNREDRFRVDDLCSGLCVLCYKKTKIQDFIHNKLLNILNIK